MLLISIIGILIYFVLSFIPNLIKINIDYFNKNNIKIKDKLFPQYTNDGIEYDSLILFFKVLEALFTTFLSKYPLPLAIIMILCQIYLLYILKRMSPYNETYFFKQKKEEILIINTIIQLIILICCDLNILNYKFVDISMISLLVLNLYIFYPDTTKSIAPLDIDNIGI